MHEVAPSALSSSQTPDPANCSGNFVLFFEGDKEKQPGEIGFPTTENWQWGTEVLAQWISAPP
jgi:hypothetical protein